MKYIALLPSLLIMAASCNIKQLQIAQAENSNTASSVTLKNVSSSLVKADSMYVCSLNMFERIHQECDSNIIFSPLGVEALFRMLQDGAGGNTASDLQQVMGVSSEEISNMTHALLDQEAVRVVRKMPRWNPGTHRDKPVKVRYTLPITFRLSTP